MCFSISHSCIMTEMLFVLLDHFYSHFMHSVLFKRKCCMYYSIFKHRGWKWNIKNTPHYVGNRNEGHFRDTTAATLYLILLKAFI